MQVGKVIKILRVQAELSQQDLAQQVGLSHGFISLIERDLRNPSIDNLIGICEILKIPVFVIFLISELEKLESDYPNLDLQELQILSMKFLRGADEVS